MFAGGDDFSLGYLLRTWIPYAQINDKKWDYVYTRAKVSGFVKVSGFLVFQVYGSARRLHYTARHSDGQYNVNNFNPLSDIMRCFDPVWRLNLIAIHLKNIHRNKLIQILYGKPFTREFSPDSNVSGYKVSTFFPGFKVFDTSYNRDDFPPDSSLYV
jgi:hypothetical protein